MTRTTIILCILTIASCNTSVEKKPKFIANDSTEYNDTLIQKTKDTSTNQTLNFKDKNGLKQGQWVTINKQKEKEIYTYRNDTLDGYYSLGNFEWRTEGYYRNGVTDGYTRTYAGNKVFFLGYRCKGKSVWHVSYSADGSRLIPIKGFSIPNDTSIYIRAPYPSGQTWYEGLFIRKKVIKHNDQSEETLSIGEHRLYFENGRIKGIVNYDKKTIAEFDINGNQKYATTFKDIHTHRQSPIPSEYLK